MALPMQTNKLMLGSSKTIRDVYQQIQKLAPVNLAVLIHGETGTGKELAAKEIHRTSGRSRKAFVAINVAAIPETLLESCLFGHKKGAFTGAIHDQAGLIEQAHGGTLFIDEIGELPLHLQAKLLRVLQERQVNRVGETHARTVDFRLVSATHRDLPQAVLGGQFREDLYYRLAGATITLPPLRDRGDDVIILADYFRRKFCHNNGLSAKTLSETAVIRLKTHRWSGNVRELENVVERAAVLSEGQEIRGEDLKVVEPEQQVSSATVGDNLDHARMVWLKNHVQTVLRKYDGHRGKSALAMGISRRTLTRYLDELGID